MSGARSPRGAGVLDRERGLALFASGRDWEASRVLARARDACVADAATVRKLGWARLAVGDAPGAATCMREALAVAPHEWESHYSLGAALRGTDDGAAMAALGAALELAPRNVECLVALSSSALGRSHMTEAEHYARRALLVAPARDDAWTCLGLALLAQERLNEAHDALLHAETLRARPADTVDPLYEDRINLDRGLALRLLDRTREAIAFYEARLPQGPDAIAHGQYALALLTRGELHRGWEQYQFRWFDPSLAAQRAGYSRPAWHGENLQGKTILLRCEQGVGDVLQFIRYAPLVRNRGATVLLELRPGLSALASALPGVDAACEHGTVARDFDCWCDLMSLPLAFGTELDKIPAEVPYLCVDDARRTYWRARLADRPRPRIGVVWAGDPRHSRDRQRSIPFETLAPLFTIPSVTWFSLQKGPASAALKSAGLDCFVVDLCHDLHDYADTAAVIDALDLVISVDTSVAHLAGALGKPVWVLLPTPADWRWMEHREDSPWYPTMRLFRQRSAGDWADVVARTAHAVESLDNRLPGESARRHASTASRRDAYSMQIDESRRPEYGVSVGIARARYTRVGWMQYLPSTEPLAVSIEYYGQYREAEVDLLARLVQRDSVIVELGSGIGYQAIALARGIGSDGRILAIEASPILRIILHQNIAACSAETVSVMPASAASTTLDALDFERLDLLKIADSEYAERLVVDGASALWTLRPIVFAAQASREALDSLAERMLDFGYRCWCVETPLFDPSNFNRCTDNVFGTANGLALLAIAEELNVAPTSRVGARITELRT